MEVHSGQNQFCRKSELYDATFCISLSKAFWSQILCHLSDINAFCLIQEYLSQTLQGSTNSSVSICPQNISIILFPLLHFYFKSFLNINSSSFNRFHCIAYDSLVTLSEYSNFQKSKKWDLIPGGSQFCKMSQLFGFPFCTSILKRFQTIILHHSLHINAFDIIGEWFSQSLQISTN